MNGAPLDPMTLGVALTVLGMGGTLLTLFVISLIADLLKRVFPVAAPAASKGTGADGSTAAN